MSTAMPLLKNFRDNLRRAVDNSTMSKTAIAEKAKIHRVTLHNILAGKFEPSLDMCERLAQALGFSAPEDIFKNSLRLKKKPA